MQGHVLFLKFNPLSYFIELYPYSISHSWFDLFCCRNNTALLWTKSTFGYFHFTFECGFVLLELRLVFYCRKEFVGCQIGT